VLAKLPGSTSVRSSVGAADLVAMIYANIVVIATFVHIGWATGGRYLLPTVYGIMLVHGLGLEALASLRLSRCDEGGTSRRLDGPRRRSFGSLRPELPSSPNPYP